MTTSVPTRGGPALPVTNRTDHKAQGRVAISVYGFANEADAVAAGFKAQAGPAMPIYIVTAAELANGTFVQEADPKATPIYTAPAGMATEGDYATPVILVGGSLSNNQKPWDSWRTDQASKRVRYGGIDQATFTADAPVVGTATGRTLISGVVTERMREDGYIRRVIAYVTGTPSGIKFKVFRPNGSNYDFVGESEPVTPTIFGKQTFNLSTPIACQCGDVLGVYLSSPSNQVGCKAITGANSIRYLDSDVTGTNVNFSNVVSNFSLCLDGYGISPYLCVIGDSIAEGHNTLNNWHTFYDNGPAGTRTSEISNQTRNIALAGFDYQNHSMGGQGLDWAFSVGMVSAVLTTPKVYLIHAGVNNVSAGSTWAFVEACLDAIKAQVPVGALLYVDEVLPWTNGTDLQAATIRTWNSNIATWCSANNSVLIVCHDAMGQIRISTGEIDDLKSAYDYDGIHLTQAGVDTMASIWYAALS